MAGVLGISGLAFSFRIAPLQKKLLANARAGLAGSWNESEYYALSRRCDIWGAIGTLTPLAAVFFMVMKPT